MSFTLIIVIMVMLALIPASAQEDGVCPGFTTRLTRGHQARVTADQGANNLRAEPSANADRVGQLQPGQTFIILEGPVCAEGYTWWLVQGSEGGYGWTAEGTSDEYWLEPDTTESVAVAGGAHELPTDVMRGMAASGFGGGGGGAGICESVDGGMVTDTIGAYGGGDESTDYEPVRYEAGETIEIDGISGSLTFMPAICVPGVTGVDAVAISPSGEELTPHFTEIIDWNTEEVFGLQVNLPVKAYAEPGLWELRAGDFSVNLELLREEAFAHMSDGFLGGAVHLYSGFAPGERVLVITNPRLGEETYEAEAAEAVANEAGYIYVELGGLIMAAVGDQGGGSTTLLGVPNTQAARFMIKDEAALDLLRRIIWEDEDIALEAWTCPGALPLRLSMEMDHDMARVITGELDIYEASGGEGAVVGQLSQGDVIEVTYGVECADGQAWWNIRLDDLFGWVPEGGQEYYLEPLDR